MLQSFPDHDFLGEFFALQYIVSLLLAGRRDDVFFDQRELEGEERGNEASHPFCTKYVPEAFLVSIAYEHHVCVLKLIRLS